jgi:anti-sigma regulatory factor (Ser/Thr protein kinase)
MPGTEQVGVTRRIAADSDAPRAARYTAVELLGQLGCGHERANDLALVVSELVTNAVVHGPGAEVELRLTGTPSIVRVEVSDGGTKSFDWPDAPGAGHWGLGLVELFSDRAGIIRDPSTVVWCELDLPEAG